MVPLSVLLAKNNESSKYQAHASVHDLESFDAWMRKRHERFLRMRLEYELGDKEKDDLYEWVFAHSAAFGEVVANLNKIARQRQPKDCGCPPGACQRTDCPRTGPEIKAIMDWKATA